MAAAPANQGDWQAWAYATELLGYVVTDDNMECFSEEELEAWETAVRSYGRHQRASHHRRPVKPKSK